MLLSRFFQRSADRPGMFGLAFLLVASSIITLTKVGLTADALAGLLPEWAFIVFALGYGLAGLLIVAGMALERLNIEAAGDALAAGGVLARLVAVIAVLPFSVPVVANATLLAVFGGIFVLRFAQCLEGEHIIRVKTTVEFTRGEKLDGHK
jgi:hypothetical protein